MNQDPATARSRQEPDDDPFLARTGASFDELLEAVAATELGRAFLEEHARRSRAEDGRAILSAIRSVQSGIEEIETRLATMAVHSRSAPVVIDGEPRREITRGAETEPAAPPGTATSPASPERADAARPAGFYMLEENPIYNPGALAGASQPTPAAIPEAPPAQSVEDNVGRQLARLSEAIRAMRPGASPSG